MTNEFPRLSQPPKQALPTVHDPNVDTLAEASLAADFFRLCRQYRRAGYEYYQRRSVLYPDNVP
ncbi:MAG: hypothetical protein H7319_13310 [Spirosoma sp.]|nr:hypothetical protein [Spirosoma sp.]